MTALSLFELDILNALQALRNPVFDIIAKALDILAARGEIFIFLTALLLIFPRTRKVGAACALALILDYVFLNLTIKPWVARIRPYDLDPGIKLITDPPHDYSFPSGHTGVAFAFASGVSPLGKKAHTMALIFACIMGFSRLYLRVHYPTDVLAGALVGTLSGLLSLFFWKKRLKGDSI